MKITDEMVEAAVNAGNSAASTMLLEPVSAYDLERRIMRAALSAVLAAQPEAQRIPNQHAITVTCPNCRQVQAYTLAPEDNHA